MNKAKIGDIAARIRRTTARLERTVARIGRYADDDQMGAWPYQKQIQDAGERVMAEIRRAQRKLGKDWYISNPSVARAVRDGHAALTRAHPFFLEKE